MTIIGITGGMGSGKSVVCNILEKLGVKIIEADKVAKSLYSIKPKLKNKIVESFGSNVLDEWGEVSFKHLAETAFKDENSVSLLNQITHPFIRDAIRDKIINHSMTDDIIAVDAALLFEGKLLYTVDYIITVTAPIDVRIKRIVDSGRFSEEEVLKRMSYQLSDEEKTDKADFVIQNNGTIKDLNKKVESIFKNIMTSTKNSDSP